MGKKMKAYAITDPQYYTNNSTKFQQILQNVIDNNPIDMICFRDKISLNNEELIKVFMKICRKKNIHKTFINTNIDLAHKYNAYGVHLTSTQFDKIVDAKKLSLQTIISCHTKEEIEKAINLGIDYITYSPIFPTPNKGEPKGINNLKHIIENNPSVPIIALGGIVTKEHLEAIQKTKAYGFASIRYFVDN
jgi:thiamine-phosphate pyrophosphorylase